MMKFQTFSIELSFDSRFELNYLKTTFTLITTQYFAQVPQVWAMNNFVYKSSSFQNIFLENVSKVEV